MAAPSVGSRKLLLRQRCIFATTFWKPQRSPWYLVCALFPFMQLACNTKTQASYFAGIQALASLLYPMDAHARDGRLSATMRVISPSTVQTALSWAIATRCDFVHQHPRYFLRLRAAQSPHERQVNHRSKFVPQNGLIFRLITRLPLSTSCFSIEERETCGKSSFRFNRQRFARGLCELCSPPLDRIPSRRHRYVAYSQLQSMNCDIRNWLGLSIDFTNSLRQESDNYANFSDWEWHFGSARAERDCRPHGRASNAGCAYGCSAGARDK